MDSNQGNLCDKILALVLGCYGVPHAEVNGTEYGGEGITGTGTGTGTGTERAGGCGRNRTNNGGSERPERAGPATE